MKRFGKNSLMIFIAMAALLALIVSPASAAIDVTKPAVVASFGSYNQAIDNINAFGEATGQPKLGNNLDMSFKMPLQMMGLDIFGLLDLDRPCGLAIYYSESYFSKDDPLKQPPPFVVFVPTTGTDIQPLVKILEGFKLKTEKLGNNHYKVWKDTPGGKGDSLFAKQQGKWLFVSAYDDLLTNLPADPTPLLDGLDKKYLFAVQLNGQDQGVKWVEEIILTTLHGVTKSIAASMTLGRGEPLDSMPKVPRPTLSDLGVLGKLLDQSDDQIDKVTLGVKCDKAGTKMTDLQLDVQVTALPGTKLAKTLTQSPEMPTQFAGFYNTDAAITMNVSAKVPEGLVRLLQARLAQFKQQALAGLADQGLNEDEQTTAKDWINRAMKTVEATLAKGHLDLGAQIKYIPEPQEMQMLLGLKLVDAQQFDTIFRQLIQLMNKEPKAPTITLDAETIEGIKFHKIEPPKNRPTPPAPLEPKAIFIGASKDAIYLAMGNDPLEDLKTAIQKSKAQATQKVPTARVSLDLPQLFQIGKVTSPTPIDEEVLAQFSEGDNKKVSLKVFPIQNGMAKSLEASPQAVQAFIDMVKVQMMKNQGTPDVEFDSEPMPARGGFNMQ